MKTRDFIKMVVAGEFKGRIIIDNDSVSAYEHGEKVCDFDGDNPDHVLLRLLKAFGVKVEFA